MSARFTLVSGGQTGVDRGALNAALALDWPCAGWCPEDRAAEDGPIPAHYPLTPLAGAGYAERTRQNVADSDATVILHNGSVDGGTAVTAQHAERLGKPCLLLDLTELDSEAAAARLLNFVRILKPARLNIAGPRASKWSAAEDQSRAVIARLLQAWQRA